MKFTVVTNSPGCLVYYHRLFESEILKGVDVDFVFPREQQEWFAISYKQLPGAGYYPVKSSNDIPKKFIEEVDIVVTGTDYCRSLDYSVDKLGYAAGKPRMFAVDFWSALEERCKNYTMHNSLVLVPNEYAGKLLCSFGIAEEYIFVLGQPEFERLLVMSVDEIYDKQKDFRSARNIPDNVTVMTFYSQPYSDYKQRYHLDALNMLEYDVMGFNELTVFENILNAVATSKNRNDIKLYLKTHPAETMGKFDMILNKFSFLNVEITSEAKDQLLFGSDANIGMHSSILVESLMLGKPAISVQIGKKYHGRDYFITNELGITKSILFREELAEMFSSLSWPVVENRNIMDIPLNSVERFLNAVDLLQGRK